MIRTEGLSVNYGKRTALRDISLTVPQGHVTAIVGPSGCGKSSFLHALNRMTDLIPGASTSGRIIIDDQDVLSRDCDVSLLRRQVGMIFQKPNPFPLSIRQNIQIALKEHGQPTRGDLEAITQQVLESTGLWGEVKDRLHHSALKLSGGQQQRLCIARALALKPRYLLLDEPCSALDPIASARVEELIASLKREYTLLIVTHNLAQARRISDDLAVFWMQDDAGFMVETGPTNKVFSTPTNPITAAYLSGSQG